MKCVLVHYSEIGTKGRNRRFFERRLEKNIRESVGGSVERKFGRIILRNPGNIEGLRKIAGVYSYSQAEEVEPHIDSIKRSVLAMAKKSKAKTFRITAIRADKTFPFSSMKVNEMLGGAVRKATKKRVDLRKAELEIFVEIAHERAYVYDNRTICMGGLPVGTAGKLVCLLSGGIDSPVAAYKMMTRGCRVVFVHFHNHDPFIGKIKELVERLSKYQGESKAYLIPFKEVQQHIIKKTDPKYRMILYRRVMMQMAEEVMKREKALGLVTGDSVAQVASQTLQNLNAIYDSIDCPVFSPLIGMNKQEIIEEARRIGTYETSIKPYTDCCSVLIARHPATRSGVRQVRDMEKKLRIGRLVKKALNSAEIVRI